VKKNIIILERRLFSVFGHERTQIQKLNEYFGYTKVVVISCKNIKLQKMNLKNKIYLNLPNIEIKKEGKETKNYIEDSAFKLQSILIREEYKIATNLIIPSARAAEISMITLLFIENKFPKKILPIVRILGINYLNNLSKDILDNFIKLVNTGFIKLCTETEELLNIVKKKYRIKNIKILIFPILVPLNYLPKKNIIKKNINIGCLGSPRPSKGTNEIPYLIKSLRQYVRKNNLDLKVTFIVQMNKDKKKRAFIFWIKEFLTRYISSSVKVKIIYGISETKKYMQLLDSIDIFLLPYRKNQYLYSGSGFIIDALLLEKPIIHSNGIAMKDLTSFHNTIALKNKMEFPIAVLNIIKNYQKYVKNTRSAKKYLKVKINNSFKFISKG